MENVNPKSTRLHLTSKSKSHLSNAIRLPHHKLPIHTTLTPTLPRPRIANTPNTLTLTLPSIPPKESPEIVISIHLPSSGRRASIRLARAVRRAVDVVVLVVCFEDGEGLGGGGAGVVAALGGLDGGAAGAGRAGRGFGVEAFAVGGGGEEGGGCEG